MRTQADVGSAHNSRGNLRTRFARGAYEDSVPRAARRSGTRYLIANLRTSSCERFSRRLSANAATERRLRTRAPWTFCVDSGRDRHQGSSVALHGNNLRTHKICSHDSWRSGKGTAHKAEVASLLPQPTFPVRSFKVPCSVGSPMWAREPAGRTGTGCRRSKREREPAASAQIPC